jgi:sulfane dehydrogenase subunit SoxC
VHADLPVTSVVPQSIRNSVINSKSKLLDVHPAWRPNDLTAQKKCLAEKETYGMSGGVRHIPESISDQTSFITSQEALFDINHLGCPKQGHEPWHLRIGGLVEKPLLLDLASLSHLATIEVTAFLKCAGSPFDPRVPTPDRIGNVVWSGICLKELLARARPLPNARYIVALGADAGEFGGHICNAYVKDVPLEALSARTALLALKMNGRDLPVARGGPVRFVVPGFYGTNSVKWVTDIELAETRAAGPFTTIWYNDEVVGQAGNTRRLPVWEVAAESAIATPRASQVVAAGSPLNVSGWAWGDAEIAQVDILLDESGQWVQTQTHRRAGHSWQAFSAILPPLSPGPHMIRSRARDVFGKEQPMANARNASVPVSFMVVA